MNCQQPLYFRVYQHHRNQALELDTSLRFDETFHSQSPKWYLLVCCIFGEPESHLCLA